MDVQDEVRLKTLRMDLQMKKQNKAMVPVPGGLEILDCETYIFDCHGVTHGIAERDANAAVEMINRLIKKEKRCMFVTNNSNRTRSELVEDLRKRGVDFGSMKEEQQLKSVVTTSYTTAYYMQKHGLKRPFVLTSDTGLLEELRHCDITEYYATVMDDGTTREEFKDPQLTNIEQIIAEHPDVDCIIVGWDLGITARKIATAINYIKWHEDVNRAKPGYRPLPIIACSGDAGGVLGTTTFKEKSVKLRAVGNGAMADIIARSFDPPLPWLSMGKPSDVLCDLFRDPRGFGVDPQRTLMVGDTLQTDIVFGNRLGAKTLLLLNGVTSIDELQEELSKFNPLRWPTYVLPTAGTMNLFLDAI